MLAINNLTKGQAANILTRLKHGAQVCFDQCPLQVLYTYTIQARFEKKVKESSRILDVMQKERDRRAREIVKVGPLHVGGIT